LCSAQYPKRLKGTTKTLALELLSLNTLKGTKSAFLTPERYDEQPRSLAHEFRQLRRLQICASRRHQVKDNFVVFFVSQF